MANERGVSTAERGLNMNPSQQVEFHASCGHMLSAPADRAGRDVRCPHCRQAVRVPQADLPDPAPLPTPAPVSSPAPAAEPIALTTLYLTALLGGLTAAGLVYLVLFDEFSEEELVTITPLWFFPIAFGLYGLVSQRLLRRLAEGRGTHGEAARMSVRVVGPLAGLMLFPFLVLKWRSSLLVALVAALVWALLLWLFFGLVFPSL
jgi:hypothetical protein